MTITNSVFLLSDSGDEYRVILVKAPIEYLTKDVRSVLKLNHVEIREIAIERIHGDNVTNQKLLHQISNWIADCFAENPHMIPKNNIKNCFCRENFISLRKERIIMSTILNQAQISTVNAMWALISQADVNVQKELYNRLRNKHAEAQKEQVDKRTGIDYIKSLVVGKGKVPAWEDGKGVLADVKYRI